MITMIIMYDCEANDIWLVVVLNAHGLFATVCNKPGLLGQCGDW